MNFDLFFNPAGLSAEFDISRRLHSAVEPLGVSPWVAMSALQKAIRRNELDLALRAAATLLAKAPAKLWRRLAGVVFEDIGFGSVSTIELVMTALTAKSSRDTFEDQWQMAAFLVEKMCAAPKCRATDDLFIALSHYHNLEDLRAFSANANLTEHLTLIRDGGAILGASMAVLHASGVRWAGLAANNASNPKAVFAVMRVRGIDPKIIALAEQGFRKTREALPMLFPLLSLSLPALSPAAIDDDYFPSVVIGRNGIPTYCLDAFSMEGKSSLGRFLKRDTSTSRFLNKHVPDYKHLSILAGGLFRIEGGLVRNRINWPCAQTLRWYADSGFHGLNLSEPYELLDIVRDDLPTLDVERANVR